MLFIRRKHGLGYEVFVGCVRSALRTIDRDGRLSIIGIGTVLHKVYGNVDSRIDFSAPLQRSWLDVRTWVRSSLIMNGFFCPRTKFYVKSRTYYSVFVSPSLCSRESFYLHHQRKLSLFSIPSCVLLTCAQPYS